jgi:DNA (cytosine-5)-methyltransferase 1
MRKFLMADMFAGCGGFSLGMEKAGFTPWFVNEIEPVFCSTYKYNHKLSDKHYYIGDIRELNTKIREYDRLLKDIDIVIGGPPCQGFSMANRQRIIDDPRNELYKAYLTFLSHVRPLFFVMENVRGMRKRQQEIYEDIVSYLGNDYQFKSIILQASDFGIPQNRERFIIIGNRLGVKINDIFLKMSEYMVEDGFKLKDALYGLPHLEPKAEKGVPGVESEASGYTECDYDYVMNDFYHFINGNKKIKKLYNHKARYNNPRDIEIFRRLPQGGNSLHESISDIMPYVRRNGIFKDKYYKLEENQVCKTITSHMKYDCNSYIHPWEARGLSPREAARIQTFPDDYFFQGSQNMWYAQIGNAVPVRLAEVIGNSIMYFMKGSAV